MIYTVSLNPSLDYAIHVNDFDTGRVNRTQYEEIFPGGKGVNVSLVLHNLNIKSKALGFTAGFIGAAFEKLLIANGLDIDFIRIPEGMTRINVKLRADDEETELNGQGPNITEEYVHMLYEKLDILEDGDYLVLAGSIPGTMPKSTYSDIMKRLENKDIRIVIDATNELLVNALAYHPFLIKPNHLELGEIFNVDIETHEDAIFYGEKLREKGARNVLISMADKGAILLAEDGTIYQSPAPKGVLRKSVGAGDSMVAGFLAGYLESGSYEKAFQYGVCAGSASAFSDNLATKAEVDELMQKTFL